MTDQRFIVIVWHQSGGRNNHTFYHLWNNEDESARVFPSKEAAQNAWDRSGIGEFSSGTIVEVTAENCEWI